MYSKTAKHYSTKMFHTECITRFQQQNFLNNNNYRRMWKATMQSTVTEQRQHLTGIKNTGMANKKDARESFWETSIDLSFSDIDSAPSADAK